MTPTQSNTEAPSPKKKHSGSKYTKVRNFRISHTHDALLNAMSDEHKPSAIIRTLLTLYFNRKLCVVGCNLSGEIDTIETLIQKEIDRTKAALSQNQQNFRERIRSNGK